MLTIHLVPNAHLDPAWLWDWREGLNEGIATCHAIVDLMQANPDVTFTRNESFIYEHIERYDPALFQRIYGLVDEGRWEIVGGTLLQPDTNMACGEGYVRQYLYGQRYFASRFGIVPEIAYQVDSFGHSAGLPTIYRAAGCRFAVQCRPSQKEHPMQSRIFRWQGPDKAEILTVNLEAYAVDYDGVDPSFGLRSRISRAKEQVPDGIDHWVVLVGLGDHGGGLNRKLLKEIREQIANPPAGCEIRFSTLRNFFKEIEGDWNRFPVVKGELQFFSRGCYTSAAPIKRANREAENLIDCAERLSAAAGILHNQQYPSERIRNVWRDILFNQFHDILPGTSIERTCNEALDHLGKARHDARWIANNAVLPIFLDIDTAKHDGVPVLLFNAHAVPYRGPVEVEWMLDYRPLSVGKGHHHVKAIQAISDDGTSVETQFLPTDCHTPIEWRVRNCFIADVPACGYKVYWLQPDAPRAWHKSDIVVEDSTEKISIANNFLKVEYRRGDDGIRIKDLVTGQDWFSGCAATGVVCEDTGDSWGTFTQSWDKVRGNFKPVSARLLQSGPIKASFVLTSQYKGSELTQEFILYTNSKQVNCSARLLWNQPRNMMKLEFPVNTANARGVFSAPYATVERPPDIGESPSVGWAAVVGDGTNIGIANNATYGFDMIGPKLRMSVVRSPGYGEMPGMEPDPQANRPAMDLGLTCFEYVISDYISIRDSFRWLNMPIHTTLGFPHSGKLPASQSVISVAPGSVNLAAVKQAEDESGWVLRLLETEGCRQEAVIKIMDNVVTKIIIEPRELVTLRMAKTGNGWIAERLPLTEMELNRDGIDMDSPIYQRAKTITTTLD